MRKTDALTLTILKTCPAKQIEDPRMVFWIYAAAVIGDLEDDETELGAALDQDVARHVRSQVLEGIVNQIGEDLFQCKAVADNIRQRFDAYLSAGFRCLMSH